jgi:hypothetical protein
MEARISWGSAGASKVASWAESWREVRATHLSLNTMGAETRSAQDHLLVLVDCAAAFDWERS